MPSVGAVMSNLTAVARNTSSGPYLAAPGQLVTANATGGPFTVTLPAQPPTGSRVGVEKADTSGNPVTVAAQTPSTINGAPTVTLTAGAAAMTVQYDGTTWQLVSTGTNLAALLPAGGTTNQVLTKTGPGDFATGWAAPGAGTYAGGFPSWVAGRINTVPCTTTALGSGQQSASAYFVPVWVPNACTIARISFLQTAFSPDAIAFLGLYSDNPAATSQGPAAKLAGGTVTLTTGPTTYSVTVNYPVSRPTLLWAALTLTTNTFAAAFQTCTPTYNFLLRRGSPVISGALVNTTLTAGQMPTDASTLAMSSSVQTPLFGFQL